MRGISAPGGHVAPHQHDVVPHPCPVPAALCLEPGVPLVLPFPGGEPFSLDETFGCGQIFRWRRTLRGAWRGPYGAVALEVQAVPGGVAVTSRGSGSGPPAGDIWRFLGLDFPLRRAREILGADAHVSRAMDATPGLRILRQDPWDCVSGFVCAQWSSVAKIERSTGWLAREWGQAVPFPDGEMIHLCPPAGRLAALVPDALRPAGLGYRCRYVVGTAQAVAAGDVDLDALRGAEYPDALAALLRLPGFGRKVADCVLLFALDQRCACPVDVWVRRAFHDWYSEELAARLPAEADALTPREHRALVQFAWDRWGDLAGYAQQYLFHARRGGARHTVPEPCA